LQRKSELRSESIGRVAQKRGSGLVERGRRRG